MKAYLIESHEIAPEVRHFTFEVSEVADLPFLPGQFVSYTRELGGKNITRAYSIVSAPNGNRFDLCLNRVQDGYFSPFLFSLQPGEAIDMKGPLGAFTLRMPPADSVLVATGTGIAPFRSMLHTHLKQFPDRQFTLIFGARYEYGLLYSDEFERLAAEYSNFRFHPTLSRPGHTWEGRQGHVQQHVLDEIGDRRDLHVYICGLKAMVDDMRARLKEIGFERRQIVYEKYD